VTITHASAAYSGTGVAPVGESARQHPATCGCPVCQGLRTFVRPRFFAGQLLTDTDLTALTGYMLDKNRLHNRYLHGYGVVCGLQVECDACSPEVIVRPGYALDACGNDIVLPDAISVPLTTLIAQCTPAAAADCDPPRHPVAKGCDEREQTWCLWVRYHERQARPVAPVGQVATAAACGCGCGGTAVAGPTSVRTGGCGCSGRTSAVRSPSTSVSGCGCGAGRAGSRSTTCGCTNAPVTVSRPAGCEPSRVYEYVEFGVMPKDGCCDDDFATAVDGTFPAKVVDCIQHLQPILTKGLTKPMQSSAASVLLGGSVGVSTGVARDTVCQLYANLLELYRKDPMRTQCVVPEELREVDCSPRQPNETDNQFLQRLVLALQKMLMLVVLYLRDCVCYALLPPCPDGWDDRVVLACVTVEDGIVTRICNHSCRRYAGSFVNREYWLPIGPVLSLLAAKLCCFPLEFPDRFRQVRDEPDAAARHVRSQPVRLARYDNLLAEVRADDFALLRLWQDRFRSTLTTVRVGAVLARVERSLEAAKGSVRLASYLHSDSAAAAAALQKKGIAVQVVEVDDRAEGLAFDAIPRVVRGDTATLYTQGGLVVGVRGEQRVRFFGREAQR
jgi:hypothetical protein